VKAINYRELKRRYELDGPQQTARHLREALHNGELQPEDFSIRELAEATLGAQWVKQLDPRGDAVELVEAGEAVDASAFSNITGQVVYSRIMRAYRQEDFVLSQLVETISTRLDGEKIPGLGRLRDEVAEVRPGMPYPSVGLGEDYIETPSTTKRGFIVPVTREAIFFDRTHLILQRAAEVGEILGLNKEKRLIDLLIGQTNTYKWKGVDYSTYYAAGASGPWVNELAGNELVDWTNVDAAEQLFNEILDPNTGEPVLVRANSVLVMPAYRHAANRVFNATEIHYGGSDSQTQTVSPNLLRSYRIYDSRLAYRRLLAAGVAPAEAKKWWFAGDFRRAFAYMENWPIR